MSAKQRMGRNPFEKRKAATSPEASMTDSSRRAEPAPPRKSFGSSPASNTRGLLFRFAPFAIFEIPAKSVFWALKALLVTKAIIVRGR